MARPPDEGSHRSYRTLAQRIVDLECRIASLREQGNPAAAPPPARRHAIAALRSLDRAIAATGESEARRILGEARLPLASLLSSGRPGRADPRPRPYVGDGRVDAEFLLAHLRQNPGQRREQIARALGLPSSCLSSGLKQLVAEGKLSTQGRSRGTTYAPCSVFDRAESGNRAS